MTAVLVVCPLSSRTLDLLVAQLRELQPVSRLLATPQCISQAQSLSSLTRCYPAQDSTWTEDASQALKAVLRSEERVVVVVGEEELSTVLQTGQDTAMKVFAIDNQSVLAVVTAAERWERLCWQGRVETVHSAVLQAVQSQVNEGLKEMLTAWEQRQTVKLDLLQNLYETKLDYFQLMWERTTLGFELLLKSLKVQDVTCLKAVTVLADRLCSVYSPPPPRPPVLPTPSTRPAPPRVAAEALSRDWQERTRQLEQMLGERLSQEALAVLTQNPGFELMSDADLISALLASS